MKNIFVIIVATIFIGLNSCSKNDDGGLPEDNFTVPELTESNTIQFTVNAMGNRSVSILLRGGKVAVDWGDGEITKRYDPEKLDRSDFSHHYRSAGEYRVRIWADELTFIRLSGLLKDFRNLNVGKCPVLTHAVLNTFTKGKSIDMNGCTNVEELEISNFAELESVNLDKCSAISTLVFYTNPNVTTLDTGNNNNLGKLYCNYCGLTSITLPKSVEVLCIMNTSLTSLTLNSYEKLINVECIRNTGLTHLDLEDCINLKALNFSDSPIASFDFSKLPSVNYIACDNTKMTSIRVGDNAKLYDLSCKGLELSSLDVTGNTLLMKLDCGDNKLTSLDISQNKALTNLYVNDNELDKESLESIFDALPARDISRLPVIKIFGNPGAETADTKVLAEKQWHVAAN